MGSQPAPATAYCGFLSLPVELRCHIYGYLYTDPQTITVSAGYITVFGSRIQDRCRETEIPGLPLELTPLVRCEYDPKLLSVANPPTVPMEDIESEKLIYPAPMALSLSCRLVYDEMTDFVSGQQRIAQALSKDVRSKTEDSEQDKDGLSLYVTYPYGVMVLKQIYPYLLKHAKRVHISGHYTPTPEGEPLPALVPSSSMNSEVDINDRLTPSSSFVAAESFGTPAPLDYRNGNSNGSHHGSLKRPAPTSQSQTHRSNTRPRLRLDPPLTSTARQSTRTALTFPAYAPATSGLAPCALSHLVSTLLPPTPTRLTKLTARILYPGENSYASVWSDEASPICHILRSICGGKIDMQVKRGAAATGVCLTARPKPESRIVSTSWEHWRLGNREGASTLAGRRRSAAAGGSVNDLDGFLRGAI